MGREKWSSLVWLAFAVFIIIGSLRLTLGNFHNPGPGFLSFCAGSIMGILAVVVHIQARRNPPKQQLKPVWEDKKRGYKMVLTVIALLGYAIGMDYLGFLISTFFFIGFLLMVIQPQKWTVVVFGALLASGVSYAIFELWLQSQLPKSPWEIF